MNELRAIAALSSKKGGENSSVVGGELGREVMGVRGKGCWENGSSTYTHTYYISGNTMNVLL